MDIYTGYRENQLRPSSITNWSRPYRWYLRGWLPHNNEAKILDIGCGEGNLLAALSEWGYKAAQGVDIRPEAVSACRARGQLAESADILDFVERSTHTWDMVFGIDILEHLDFDRALKLLRALRSTLRPGGAIILQTPNMASPFGGHVQFGDLTHRMALTPDSLTQLLRMAGFTQIDLRPAGPGPWSVLSACRYGAWQICISLLRVWTLIETGSLGSQVLTRVMFCRGMNG